MDRNEIIETIKTIISDETEIPKEDIQENSLLMRDLELSSLEVLAIIGKLEEKYGVRVEAEELHKITMIGEIVDYLINISAH